MGNTQEKTTYFITNKFHISQNNTERFEMLLENLCVMHSGNDNSCTVADSRIVVGHEKELDFDGNETTAYQIHGIGELMYDDGTVSKNVLKIAGNMTKFMNDLSALTSDGVILMIMSISTDGWTSSKGFAAFNGQSRKIDLSESLVASLNDMGCDKCGYEMRPVLG